MTCNTVGPSTPHLVELKSGFLEVDLKKSQGELQMGGSPPQYTQCEQRREGSVGVRWELEPPAVSSSGRFSFECVQFEVLVREMCKV